MNVEATGGDSQGLANIGAFNAQSEMEDSTINIQAVRAQTKMGGVSLTVGEINTVAISQQIGSNSPSDSRCTLVSPRYVQLIRVNPSSRASRLFQMSNKIGMPYEDIRFRKLRGGVDA
ncbi:hypothetical protein QJS10_CPA16g00659 [Acorus calamus]|uniref:Uncharacterized protein n=1 Tax=Acorus calamus TaxID=4465 RepID=A0AAV9D027_ACOCL|nr:hypothetical protein QJS10_CPA16g00659 [Acorus calamus]